MSSSIVSQIECLEDKVNVCKKRLDAIDQSLRHGEITDLERKNLLDEEIVVKEQIGEHEIELKSLRSENRKSMLISVAIFGIMYLLYAFLWRTS